MKNSAFFTSFFLASILYSRDLQTTVRGPNLARETISSDRKDILSILEK